MSNYIVHRSDTYLQHFGIRGQKWGVRRFQNEDGSYKPGAEGRYAQPVKGTISGPKYNASSSGPFSYVGSGAGKKSIGVKVSDKYGKISGGGGGGSKASETEEETNEKIDRKNIHIYDVSEKLPEKGSKTAKGGSGKGSSSSKKTESEKKEKEENKKEEKKSSFKPDDLYSKIDGLELDSLSDTDQKELDDLITEWRTYRSTHTASNKKSREIDEFIQQYERWKSDKKKPRDDVYKDPNEQTGKSSNGGNIVNKARILRQKVKSKTGANAMHYETTDREYELYHFGVRGMKWGIRRYQNEDGSYKSGAEGRYDPESSGKKQRKITVKGSSAGKSFDTKKALKIGAGVAGAAIAAGGAYYLHKSGKGKELVEKAKELAGKTKEISNESDDREKVSGALQLAFAPAKDWNTATVLTTLYKSDNKSLRKMAEDASKTAEKAYNSRVSEAKKLLDSGKIDYSTYLKRKNLFVKEHNEYLETLLRNGLTKFAF